MTITTQPARNEYTANAGQTVFNYTFKIFSSTDLNVYVTPAGADYDDSVYLTTDYVVDPSGIGDEDGGFITLNTPTNQGDRVTIVLNVPSSRTIDYQNNGDFRPDTVNSDFDRVVSIAKKVEDLTNRAVLLEQSTQGPKPLNLGEPVPNKLVVWNDAGNKLESSTSSPDTLEDAQEYVDFLEVYSEDDVPTTETPEGKTVTTIFGQNQKIDDTIQRAEDSVAAAIGSLARTDAGDYETPGTYNTYNDYLVYQRGTTPTRWAVNGNVPLPYTVNSAVNPNDDPNIYQIDGRIKVPDSNVSLPFNSKIVDKLDGPLSVSRNSRTLNVTKSGIVEQLGVDDIAITKDGVSAYDSYINQIFYSEDYTQSDWFKNGIGIVENAIDSPQAGVKAQEITDNDGVNRYIRQTPPIITGGEFVTLSAFFKQSTSQKVGVRLALTGGSANFGVVSYDFSTGQLSIPPAAYDGGVDILNNGWVRIWITIENAGGNTTCDSRIAPSDFLSSSVGDSCYAWGAQLTLTTIAPYIKTTDTLSTRARDLISFPVSANLPVSGEDFTIMFKSAIPSDGVERTLFCTETNDDLRLARDASGNLVFKFGGDLSVSGVDIESHVFAVRLSDFSKSIHVDGVQIAIGSGIGGSYDSTEGFYVGANAILNGPNTEISDFMIFDKALTDEEISMVGSSL